MSNTLYAIHEELQALLDAAVDTETGEIDEDALQRMDELHVELDAKVGSYAALIKRAEADAKAMKAHLEEYTKPFTRRIATNATLAKRLRERLCSLTPRDYKLRSNDSPTVTRGTKNFVEVVDESRVTKAYRHEVVPELDKNRILDILKADQRVPGCELGVKDKVTIK